MTDAKSSGAVLESVLEAVFRESDPGGNVPGEGPSWATVLQHLSWPSGAAQLQALLTAAVAQVLHSVGQLSGKKNLLQGGVLLLHAHLRHRQPSCGSTQVPGQLSNMKLIHAHEKPSWRNFTVVVT